ncbi:MAG: hypothetical protein KA735_13315 [Burkholderiaceae bacterium]|nr:hypothetical protein [Burkholderiaceae bacterium]
MMPAIAATVQADNKSPAWDLMVVSAVALFIAYWLVPRQIPASQALGLAPELLPTVSALSIAALSLLGFVLSCIKGTTPGEENQGPWMPILGFIGLCTLGVVIVSYGGLTLSTLYLVPVLMWRLGEHRLLRIAPTALIAAALLYTFIR